MGIFFIYIYLKTGINYITGTLSLFWSTIISMIGNTKRVAVVALLLTAASLPSLVQSTKLRSGE